jgi:hypothetical protein
VIVASIIAISLFVDDETDLEDFSLGQVIDLIQTLRTSGRIIDGDFSSKQTIPELDDSVVNETYVSGEAFAKKWVWYSPSEQAKTGYGYWCTKTRGFEDQNLATRFLPLRDEAAHALGDRTDRDLTIVQMD